MNRKRPLIVRLVNALRLVATDHHYRNVLWLRLVRPRGVFQPFNNTKSNRYPKIFSFVQSQLGADSEVRLLSFGCSTGEEVFSLRRYFPHATIKCIDINPANIAICRKRLRGADDPRISFTAAASTTDEPAGFYDAIFCMAVLRHGQLALPGTSRCDHLLRFEDFAATVKDLSRCLKPGGLLAIRHSNFRLRDAPAGAEFETLLRIKAATETPLFGPDNQRLEGESYPDSVFRKLPA